MSTIRYEGIAQRMTELQARVQRCQKMVEVCDSHPGANQADVAIFKSRYAAGLEGVRKTQNRSLIKLGLGAVGMVAGLTVAGAAAIGVGGAVLTVLAYRSLRQNSQRLSNLRDDKERFQLDYKEHCLQQKEDARGELREAWKLFEEVSAQLAQAKDDEMREHVEALGAGLKQLGGVLETPTEIQVQGVRLKKRAR